ncbi:28S ribosomal protein S34, mitochondrial [Diprion similis]|uniref:28S ribosomal protein S34, mitochondrial n=1 Tax=Diprion similis TaxID=362088 RepID=UPI001EF896D9|nr:28S ribosomal protein S34, mitochondrial [Diprion similis]
MPIKYIGRTTDFKGKSLWEIVGNLKNGGIGRIVIRQMFERYPEPSFIKILKVEAMPYEEPRKVTVCVERTFRGIKYNEPEYIKGASYKSDYQLIPKDQEAAYCKIEQTRPTAILARTCDFPPLYKEMLIRKMKAKGTPITEEPKLEIQHKTSPNKLARVAEEGETPTVNMTIDIGPTRAPRLYENIKP